MSAIDLLDITHDRRCEQADVLVPEPGRCRCQARRAARALTRECGVASALSDEAVAYAVPNVGDLLDDMDACPRVARLVVSH